jgi:hypothetical protein
MRRDGKKPMDAFFVLAKAGFGDRRRRSLTRIAVTFLVFVLLLALPIYFLWPEPEQPSVFLAACDQVGTPGESTSLCACVEAMGEDKTKAILAGRDVYFHDLQTDWQQLVATDSHGVVTLQRNFSSVAATVEIMVRYPGDGQRRPGVQAKARVFVWPPETPLLMVDVDHTLADVNAATLWDANNLDIRPRPGAVAALRAARAKYRIGYLSAGADLPSRYNKLRAWLERGWAPEQEQFPNGPVLSRACRPPLSDASKFLQATLKDFKQRFRGTMVAITGDGVNAQSLYEAGWRTFLLSEAGDAPNGVTGIKSWSEFSRQLP